MEIESNPDILIRVWHRPRSSETRITYSSWLTERKSVVDLSFVANVQELIDDLLYGEDATPEMIESIELQAATEGIEEELNRGLFDAATSSFFDEEDNDDTP